MKFLVFVCLFISSISLSQNNVSITFENFQDTIFRGFDNPIYLKGVKDLKGLVIVAEGASISLIDEKSKKYILKPSSSSKNCTLVVTKNKKEILRKQIVISNLQGRQLEILKNKTKTN